MTTNTAITGVRSITHLYRGGEGWTHPLYLISYEWIFLNNLLQLTNMKLFAALERALLARWRKIKVALKVNKWPLLSLKEQRLQLKKQYLESLFRKKWQKFERSIIRMTQVVVSPLTVSCVSDASLLWWLWPVARTLTSRKSGLSRSARPCCATICNTGGTCVRPRSYIGSVSYTHLTLPTTPYV